MSLYNDRAKFTRLLVRLIQYINNQEGYECTLGDVFAREGHCKNSFHYRGLAADINLFKKLSNGKIIYLTKTENHYEFGQYWKSLDPMCTWGGDFKRKDGNHYSYKEGK